jgi:NADPH-ferrihemoprotein reductase
MDISKYSTGLLDLQLVFNSLFQLVQSPTLPHNLLPSSIADILAVLIFTLTTLGYVTRGRYWDRPDPHYHAYFEKPQVTDSRLRTTVVTTRNISQRLEAGGHQCVIFWGSQSGTAERLAEQLGRECAAAFDINALVADLSDYDAESIGSIKDTHFAVFILSTYGEGDPSDNASGLWDWIKHVNTASIKLDRLRYIALGLGNSNYKYYNRVLDVVADGLNAAGAHALMPRQRADDAHGATEEDFQSWKDDIFTLFRSMGYEQKTIKYRPSIELSFTNQNGGSPGSMISSLHQRSTTNSAITPLVIKSSRQLFAGGDRDCVHVELDLNGTNLGYKTGDHIGIWPCNPNEEVERLVSALGLQYRQTESFTVLPFTESTKPKVPSPTTLDAAFRHHLEICGPVARKTVLELAQFAPTAEARTILLELGQNRDTYEQRVANTHITFSRLLQLASPFGQWHDLPLPFVIEVLLPLQPRYYSISSSSVISPRRLAITALVVNRQMPVPPGGIIYGLTSNYLLSASNVATPTTACAPSYRHIGRAGGTQCTQVLAHIRKSKFKLPITSSTPLILVSAGTGFAPFRAFLQERAKLHAIGKPIGNIVLFFGCRNQDDFIYRGEIEKMQAQLDGKLEIFTAFSRSGDATRTYVQDRVGEHAAKVLGMFENGANMYICGKASMAREVDMKIEEAVGSIKQMGEVEVKAWVDALKKRGKWKADVWG